jgi:16S rRNA (guanine1207-N2)-methyltransferase
VRGQKETAFYPDQESVSVSNHYFSKKPKSKIERGLIRTNLRGKYYEFLTASGLFSNKRIDLGTRILIENMILPKKGRLLDLGCGNGVIGLVAASINRGLNVTLTDVNERATAIAKENAERMKLNNIRILTGHIYEPIKNEKFDIIITNPPVSAGMNKIIRIIVEEAIEHLNSCGVIQLVIQWNKGGRTLAKLLENSFGSFEVLKRKSGYRVFISRL